MKFDYIVGNPPYQNAASYGSNKKLWKDITKKMIKAYNIEIAFITPDTYVQYLCKENKTKLINYTANNYFNVGVTIIMWIISNKSKKTKIINLDGTENFIKEKFDWYEKSSRKKIKNFGMLKKTKPNNRMFKRQSCGNGELVCIKNENKNTLDVCKEYVIPKNNKKMVISTSQSLTDKNIRITTKAYGSLYVQIDIDDWEDAKIQKLKDFLLSNIFVNYCNEFKKTYGTGFNNVLIYLPEINLNNEISKITRNFNL